jgi:alginate O-acetyltransferase complex protein AlgI
MVFSSAIFLFYFLPIVLAVYYALVPFKRVRNVVVLAASLLFYSWGEGLYTLLMLLSVAANYGFGIYIHTARQKSDTKVPIAIALAFNIALLVVFKYTNFIVNSLNSLTVHFYAAPIQIGEVHLPLGISFFTFHCISYIMDVYRGQVPPQRSLSNMALYISFFPQLIAGPIIRYKDICAQLVDRKMDLERFSYGVNRFITGLGKKVLIANSVSVPADQIFALSAGQLNAPVAWLGLLCFTLQIYFDFSGYSDMAIGLAHMFGFAFKENFNYPYISRSLHEFWRRWHISLSTWFRDYLFIALGGNRVSPVRTNLNLAVVFLLCGLWHGPSWNFVVFGVFHGFFLVLERTRFVSYLSSAPRLLAIAYTMLVAMTASVFFRAKTLPLAFDFIRAMAGFGTGMDVYPGQFLNRNLVVIIAIALVGSTPIVHWLGDFRRRTLDHIVLGPFRAEDGINAFVSLIFLPVVYILCMISLASGIHNPFIYFQF